MEVISALEHFKKVFFSEAEYRQSSNKNLKGVTTEFVEERAELVLSGVLLHVACSVLAGTTSFFFSMKRPSRNR